MIWSGAESLVNSGRLHEGEEASTSLYVEALSRGRGCSFGRVSPGDRHLAPGGDPLRLFSFDLPRAILRSNWLDHKFVGVYIATTRKLLTSISFRISSQFIEKNAD